MRTYQGFNPNLSLLLQCRMMHFDAALLMVLLIDVHHSFSKRSSNKRPTRVFKPMFIKSISCNSPVGLLKSTLAISPPSAIMLLSMWIAQNKDFCLHQNSFSSLSSAHEKQEQTQKRFVYNFVECRYFSITRRSFPLWFWNVLKKEDEWRVSRVTEGQSTAQNGQLHLCQMLDVIFNLCGVIDSACFVWLLLTTALMFYASCES